MASTANRPGESLQEALTAWQDAEDRLQETAIAELSATVLNRYPTAKVASVLGVSTPNYSDHNITVYDADGNRLNNDDWPWEGEDEDWLITVTEAICRDGGTESVDIVQPEPEIEEVTFLWSTKHGQCYDCGRPAAFYVPDAYGDVEEMGEHHKRCAVCAANDAVLGERIIRIEPDEG